MLIYQRVIVIPTCQRVALIQETMEPMPFPIQYQLFPYSSTIPFITLLGAGRYSDSLREICDEFMTWFVHPVSLIIQPINWLVQFPLYLSICQSPAHCAHIYIILYTYMYDTYMHTWCTRIHVYDCIRLPYLSPLPTSPSRFSVRLRASRWPDQMKECTSTPEKL